MPDENLSFLWILLSQTGIRERSHGRAKLAQGISLPLDKWGNRQNSSWAASTWAVFVSGMWDDTKQGQFEKKGAKKKTTDPIQCDSRGKLWHGKKSTLLYVWCTAYTWTTSAGLRFEYPCDLEYLIWVCLKSQWGHSGIVIFPSSSCHSMAPPAHCCSLLSYNT